MKKKGAVIDILILIVVAFVTIMFFALWIYGFGQITDTLGGISDFTLNEDKVSISNMSRDTFGQVHSAQTTGLHVIAYVMIFAMALTILISNFLVKANPVFFILYIFVTITGIIVSVYISNQYEIYMQDTIIGSSISGFVGGSYIMLYLPIWIAVIGILGAVLLFSGIIRDGGAGGGLA